MDACCRELLLQPPSCAPSFPLAPSRDSVDFVQQGALIAAALVLIEQPDSRAKSLRTHIDGLYGNKGAEVRTRRVRCGSV